MSANALSDGVGAPFAVTGLIAERGFSSRAMRDPVTRSDADADIYSDKTMTLASRSAEPAPPDWTWAYALSQPCEWSSADRPCHAHGPPVGGVSA
jgi:hypothetical protein